MGPLNVLYTPKYCRIRFVYGLEHTEAQRMKQGDETLQSLVDTH